MNTMLSLKYCVLDSEGQADNRRFPGFPLTYCPVLAQNNHLLHDDNTDCVTLRRALSRLVILVDFVKRFQTSQEVI